MKGDYSQLGLMPSRYLEQIDLPSAYLGPVPLSLLSTELSYAKARLRTGGGLKQQARLNPSKSQARAFFATLSTSRAESRSSFDRCFECFQSISDFLNFTPDQLSPTVRAGGKSLRRVAHSS
jgi:hypothetical protein